MKKEFTEKEIKEFASQLRKPNGEKGKEVAELMQIGNEPMNLHAIAVLNPQPKDVILEVGMGNGYFVKNIIGLDESIKYIGCDYSELMIEQSKNNNREFVNSGQAEFHHADISNLPFQDEIFTKIITINTFYFWSDYKKVIKELKRVLAKQGELIIAVRPKENMIVNPVTKFNFNLFTLSEILEMLKQQGFNEFELTEINEPDQIRWGNVYKRQSMILKFKKYS